MTADLLRKAANAERDEWGGADTRHGYPKSSRIHLAVADWLDKEATFADLGNDWISPHAVVVAHAILDGAS